MAGLKFLIKGDDSPIRKTLEKLKKDVANNQKAAVQSTIAATDTTKKKQKEVLDTINAQTKAIKERNKEDEKVSKKRAPKPAPASQPPAAASKLSNSRSEVDAYQASKVGAPNMTGPLVAPRSQQDLINQFKQLDVEQTKLTANYKAGKISADTYAKTIDALSKKQAELRTAIQNYNKGQDAAAVATTKANGATKTQIGLLDRLNGKLKTYKEKKTGLLDVDQIANANRKIQETEHEIARLNNIGRIGFDELGNKIEGTTGKIDRLKRISSGYRLMADSSKDLNQITVFNAKAQQAADEAQRLSNVGKKGFDELGNKIKSSGSLLGKMWTGLRGVANVLPGIGIAGLLAFAIEPLMNYLSGLDMFKRKLDEAQKAQATLNSALAGSEYSKAVKEVNELAVNVDLAKRGLISKNDVVKQYNESIGKTAGQVKSLVEVEDFLAKNADAYVKMTLYKAAAQLALEEASKKAFEAEQARINGEVPLSNAVGHKGDGLENLTIGDRLKAAFTQDENFTKELVKNRTKIIVDGKKKEEEEQERIALSFQKKAAELAKKFNGSIFGLDPKEGQFGNAQAKYQAMLDDIAKLTDEYSRKALTEEEEAKRAVVDRFAEMRRQLIAYNTWAAGYNKKAPAGKQVATIGLGVLDPIKKKALDDLSAKQEVARAKIAIEQQKQVYSQYEDFKLEYGRAKADQRFAEELKGYTSYVAFIQAQLKSLEGKNDAGSNALKDFYTKELPKAQKEANDKQFDNHMRDLSRIMEATKTAANEEKRIDEQYYKDLATLRKEYAGEELAEREKALAENHKKELAGVRQLAWEQTEIAKRMAEDLFFKTRQQLKEQIRKLRQDLKDPSLTPAQKQAGKQALDQAQNLYEQTSEFAELNKEIQEIGQQAVATFQQLGSSLEGINDDLSYTVNQVALMGDILLNLANDLASGNPVRMIAGVIKTIAALFSMGKRVREMNEAARAAQKKYYDEAIKGEQEYQALLRKRELDTVARGKTSYQAIIAQLEALKKQSPEVQRAYDAIFKSLQGEEFVSDKGYKHGTWFRKAKTWDVMSSLAGSDYDKLEHLYSQGKLKDQALADFEALKKLREELEQAGLNVEELQAQLKEMLTGTSVEGLSDALADLFENGKLSAQDFGDTFESIMGKAILNTFKYSVIEKAMGPLFDQLAKMTEGGKIPGAAEIQAFLQNATLIGEQLGGQWKAITDGMKEAGLDFFGAEDGSNNSLQGAYKTASQESINLLAGNTAGLRIATIETNRILGTHTPIMQQQLQIAMQGIQYQQQIAANTLRTANNTGALAQIREDIQSLRQTVQSNNNSAQAAGFRP